jgi:hypothetical protein
VTRGLEILAGRGCFRCRWRGGRNEHFIESIVFQSKYPIYHLFLALSERCPKVFAVNKRTCLYLIDRSQAVLECVHVARRTASAFYSTFAWNACHTYPESSPDDYRDEGVPTQHEENVRQQILEGLIAAKGGGLSP